jgi:hypothetical protein
MCSETDVSGIYSTSHGVALIRELRTPVVLVDIFHIPGIWEQASSMSNLKVD